MLAQLQGPDTLPSELARDTGKRASQPSARMASRIEISSERSQRSNINSTNLILRAKRSPPSPLASSVSWAASMPLERHCISLNIDVGIIGGYEGAITWRTAPSCSWSGLRHCDLTNCSDKHEHFTVMIPRWSKRPAHRNTKRLASTPIPD